MQYNDYISNNGIIKRINKEKYNKDLHYTLLFLPNNCNYFTKEFYNSEVYDIDSICNKTLDYIVDRFHDNGNRNIFFGITKSPLDIFMLHIKNHGEYWNYMYLMFPIKSNMWMTLEDYKLYILCIEEHFIESVNEIINNNSFDIHIMNELKKSHRDLNITLKDICYLYMLF